MGYVLVGSSNSFFVLIQVVGFVSSSVMFGRSHKNLIRKRKKKKRSYKVLFPKIQAVLTLNGSLQHMWSKWKSVGHNFQVLYLGISSQKIKTTPIFAHSFLRNFIGSMFIADHHWSFFLFDSDVLGMMEFSRS